MRRMTAAMGAFALAMTGTSVQSAPPGSGTIDIRSAAQASSSRHQIGYRLCWREGGARHCRWVDSARIYGYRSATAAGRAVRRVYGYRSATAVRRAVPRVYRYRSATAVRRAVPRVYGYTALPAMTVNPSPQVPPAYYGYTALPAITAYPPPLPLVIYTPSYSPEAPNWSEPDVYATGSADWWRVMDHNDRGGQAR